MHKEVKIGLAVMGALMLALGGVAYWRFTKHAEPFATEQAAGGDSTETAAGVPPAAATIVAAEPLPTEPANGGYEETHVAGLTDGQRHDAENGAPATSYLPDHQATADYDSQPRPYGGQGDEPAAPKKLSQKQSATGKIRRLSAELPSEEMNTAEPAPALMPADSTVPQELSQSAEEPAAAETADASNWPTRGSAQATAATTGPPAYEAVADRRASQAWPATQRNANADFGQSNAQAPQDDFANMPQQTVPQEGSYSVQPNDSFATISKKVYGTEGYFKALREVNRAKFPRASQLQVGDVVSTPSAQELLRDYPDLCPKPRRQAAGQPRAFAASSSRQGIGGKRYVVAEGDSLFDIARYELGKASRWAEIYELNRDSIGEDFDYLKPGTELMIPASGQDADSMTRQGGPTLR